MSGSWLKNNFVFNFLHFLKIVLVAVSIYFILSFLSVPRVWTLSLCFLLLAVWYIGLLATTVRAKESGLSIYEYLKHQEEEKLKQAKEAGFETYWEYLAHQRKEEKAQRKAKAAKQKAERKAKREAIAAERKAKREAIAAERKAKQEAKAAERKAKQEAKAAKREAERKAKQEAKAAKQKAERKAKRKAKAERKAKREAKAAKREAERKAKREAIAAKREAERKAKITKERTSKSKSGAFAAGLATGYVANKLIDKYKSPPRVVFTDPTIRIISEERKLDGWRIKWARFDRKGKKTASGTLRPRSRSQTGGGRRSDNTEYRYYWD